MYFVDREKIEKILLFFEEIIKTIEEQKTWETVMERKALERMVQTMIESIFDVGNSMIDGFIMRDPGSFDDIIDILEDEKVLTLEHANSLKLIIGLRKMLVQEYTDIEHDLLLKVLKDNIESLKDYSISVRNYLEHEIGPVSAFRH